MSHCKYSKYFYFIAHIIKKKKRDLIQGWRKNLISRGIPQFETESLSLKKFNGLKEKEDGQWMQFNKIICVQDQKDCI